MPQRPRRTVSYVSTALETARRYEPVPLVYPNPSPPTNPQPGRFNSEIAVEEGVSLGRDDSETEKSVIFKMGDTVKYNNTRTKVTGIGKCFCGCDYVTYTLAAIDGEFFGSSLEKCSNFKSITLEYGENK